MFLQFPFLHGQLVLFQLHLESLIPTENSLILRIVGFKKQKKKKQLLLRQITTFVNTDTASYK